MTKYIVTLWSTLDYYHTEYQYAIETNLELEALAESIAERLTTLKTLKKEYYEKLKEINKKYNNRFADKNRNAEVEALTVESNKQRVMQFSVGILELEAGYDFDVNTLEQFFDNNVHHYAEQL